VASKRRLVEEEEEEEEEEEDKGGDNTILPVTQVHRAAQYLAGSRHDLRALELDVRRQQLHEYFRRPPPDAPSEPPRRKRARSEARSTPLGRTPLRRTRKDSASLSPERGPADGDVAEPRSRSLEEMREQLNNDLKDGWGEEPAATCETAVDSDQPSCSVQHQHRPSTPSTSPDQWEDVQTLVDDKEYVTDAQSAEPDARPVTPAPLSPHIFRRCSEADELDPTRRLPIRGTPPNPVEAGSLQGRRVSSNLDVTLPVPFDHVRTGQRHDGASFRSGERAARASREGRSRSPPPLSERSELEAEEQKSVEAEDGSQRTPPPVPSRRRPSIDTSQQATPTQPGSEHHRPTSAISPRQRSGSANTGSSSASGSARSSSTYHFHFGESGPV